MLPDYIRHYYGIKLTTCLIQRRNSIKHKNTKVSTNVMNPQNRNTSEAEQAFIRKRKRW